VFTVKRALEKCCLQLKATLLKQRALADDKERRKNLTKYIPDVSTAIYKTSTIVQNAPRDCHSAKFLNPFVGSFLRVLL
jgi:DNA topoisomerase-6 subunit B